MIHVSLTISPILDASGTIVGASKIARDVTERKRAEVMLRRTSAKLARLATTDMLTGLRNSRHLHEALPVAFSMAARTDRPLSVIMLDVDHFKAYNDSFGQSCRRRGAPPDRTVLRRMIRTHRPGGTVRRRGIRDPAAGDRQRGGPGARRAGADRHREEFTWRRDR